MKSLFLILALGFMAGCAPCDGKHGSEPDMSNLVTRDYLEGIKEGIRMGRCFENPRLEACRDGIKR